MKIPAFTGNTAKDYLDHLGRQIGRADDRWMAYAGALSADYSNAYNVQSIVLTNVKKSIDARKAFEHEMITLTLSLLTVGVAGAVAGIVARSATAERSLVDVEANAVLASKKYDKAWEDAIKDTVKAVVKIGSEKLGSAVAPKATVAGDPFAPAGVTPTEWWGRMFYGFKRVKASLDDFVDALNGKTPGDLELVVPGLHLYYTNNSALDTTEAKRLVDMVLDTPYFVDCLETSAYEPGAFANNVSLALWMGWAYRRDVKYWKFEHDITNTMIRNEQIDWEPLRQVLITLGVPAFYITPRYDLLDSSRTDYFQNPLVKGLDMWGFFRWMTSAASRSALIDGLPKNADGFELVKNEMDKMKLTEQGWVRH